MSEGGVQLKAWIRITDELEAQGELKQIYEIVRGRRGSVSNVMKAQSLDPQSIGLHLDLYLHLMFDKSTLTRLEREMIAVAVSQLNNCGYCIAHHSEALVHHSKNPKLLGDLKKRSFENLAPPTRAMLEYAVKLTEHPEQMLKTDIDKLRTASLTDQAILRVNLITSYFNFVNRIVSGLGVELENEESRIYKY